MTATFDLALVPGAAPQCSRAGCVEVALWRINWRNPRIHAADRVKIWAACADHRQFLADYLLSRAFPVSVTGIDEDVERLDDGAGTRRDADAEPQAEPAVSRPIAGAAGA